MNETFNITMMRNSDLESLFKKINGHILLVKAYTQNDDLVNIIKGCRLKPYSIFTGDFEPGTKFEKHWVDEFGNSLKFNEKTPYVVMGDTEIMPITQTSTDLFYGRSAKKISSISKFALIARANYLDKECYVVAFYGEDEYIRVFLHNGKWNNMSPLLLGTEILHEFFHNLTTPWISNIYLQKKTQILGLTIDKCITTAWPSKQNILTCFDDDIIASIL